MNLFSYKVDLVPLVCYGTKGLSTLGLLRNKMDLVYLFFTEQSGLSTFSLVRMKQTGLLYPLVGEDYSCIFFGRPFHLGRHHDSQYSAPPVPLSLSWTM